MRDCITIRGHSYHLAMLSNNCNATPGIWIMDLKFDGPFRKKTAIFKSLEAQKMKAKLNLIKVLEKV